VGCANVASTLPAKDDEAIVLIGSSVFDRAAQALPQRLEGEAKHAAPHPARRLAAQPLLTAQRGGGRSSATSRVRGMRGGERVMQKSPRSFRPGFPTILQNALSRTSHVISQARAAALCWHACRIRAPRPCGRADRCASISSAARSNGWTTFSASSGAASRCRSFAGGVDLTSLNLHGPAAAALTTRRNSRACPTEMKAQRCNSPPPNLPRQRGEGAPPGRAARLCITSPERTIAGREYR
jgi:hypothetical protein